ncbi:MAG: class I SAM-dependent methyltransferase [Bacteroidales bacterium]|nr:class I SAM-dependent methyltransferase [Bacteroidales bacterium]
MKNVIDPIWEKIHSSQEWGKYPSEPVIRFVARNFYNTDRNKVKILDYGCGQGAHTWYLANEGFDTYAFDGSQSAVAKTKDRLDNSSLNATLSVMDAVSIDYTDNFFDAVIDSFCICSNRISDISIMYKNVYRILKNGGRLLTLCFGEELDGYKTGKEIEKGTYTDINEGALANRGICHFFTKTEIENILAYVGFKDIQIEWCKYTDRGHLVHQYICSAIKE